MIAVAFYLILSLNLRRNNKYIKQYIYKHFVVHSVYKNVKIMYVIYLKYITNFSSNSN